MWVRGDNGETPFKPYQLTFIDDATRVITGTVLIAGWPRSVGVIAALATAIRGYTAPDGTFVGGIPDTVWWWDNGREFLNGEVTAACVRLGIGPRPASPHAGWHISSLGPGSVGRWLVRSRRTVHVLDLDARTYERRPGPTSQSFAYDNQAVPLARVEVWPEVDGRMLVWFDDPHQPERLEHYRVCSRIRSITRAATADDTDAANSETP